MGNKKIVCFCLKFLNVRLSLTCLKLGLILCCFSASGDCVAQDFSLKNVIISGTVKNRDQKYWEFWLTDFFTQGRFVSIPIDSNGKFQTTFQISHSQNITLMLNGEEILLFAIPGETLHMSWDEKYFSSSFKIQTFPHTVDRQREIDLMLALHQKYNTRLNFLKQSIEDGNEPREKVIENVKSLYKEYNTTISSYPSTSYRKRIVTDLFYFFQHQLIDRINIIEQKKGIENYVYTKLNLPFENRSPNLSPESTLEEDIFFESANYREYIFDKITFHKTFNAIVGAEVKQKANLILDRCYAGLSELSLSPVIKDWYITYLLFDGFEHYDFETVDTAYKVIKNQIQTKYFADSLRKFSSVMSRLKLGTLAPNFSLKSETGKLVSLSDFRGKVVYIDFWGVYCGPCLSDIEECHEKVVAKYKNVAFINICVDATEKNWLIALKKYNLKGTNLIAEGWIKNPVCRAYGINALPHYVLIDKNGRMIRNNAPRLFEILNGNEILDNYGGL